jgi:hypothetical protein
MRLRRGGCETQAEAAPKTFEAANFAKQMSTDG